MNGAVLAPMRTARAIGRAGRICAAATLSAAVATAGHAALVDPPGARLVPWRVERDLLRFKTVATDNVMRLLAIRPGMTILDVGAGTGQFAYEFAGRLAGTGTVDATDSNPYCVDHMKKEAGKRGLGNLRPALVRPDGIDGFYRGRSYDLITVFHLSMAYEDRVGYLSGLREALAPGGRLVLIVYKTPTPFSPDDFAGDVRELAGELTREPPESPFRAIPGAGTRAALRAPPEATETVGALKRALAEDFNRAVFRSELASWFHPGSVFRKALEFTPEERGFAEWILLSFPEKRVPMRDGGAQAAAGGGMYPAINKLLLVQKYRRFLRADRLFASGFTPAVRAAFEQAGFRLERHDPDIIPFEDLAIFSGRAP